MNGLKPRPGSSIAILGSGPVGMAAILGSVVSGCGTVIAVDRNDGKLELAKRLGATAVINTTRMPDVATAIRAQVPRGVNFIVDAAGAPALTGIALGGLARRGTLCLVASAPSPETTLDLPWSGVLVQGLTIRGFVEGNSVPDFFIPRLIDLYTQGRFPFDKLVRFYPFDEINRAVEDQRNGVAIKPILEVSAA
jgi:aryl-alcohol dehydrogenase